MGYKRTIAPALECPFQPGEHCRTCDCKRRCFFNFLSPESLRRFRLERRMRRYKARQYIFQEGEQPQGLFILCVGDVKMSKTDDRGRELTLHYLSCGDLVGEVPFLAGEPYCASAETLRESVVCFLPGGLVEYISAHEPEFSRRLARRVSRFVCRTMDRAFGFAFRGAEARLAAFLLSLKAPPAPAVALPCHGRFDYSRREIAQNLGLSPETVIRALSSFQRRGLVRLDGKAIEIRDRAGLETVAAEH
ncbi:MAG: Crp/Fnr family transcriptional regulator [Elusimicrobia bacterium]|jgi:CRP/FNR family transcriptional regulator|nr:Crp/Fnr family transcriptional regulator [Elusimicrobiota bacterium]